MRKTLCRFHLTSWRKIAPGINADLTIFQGFANHGLTVAWSIDVNEKQN